MHDDQERGLEEEEEEEEGGREGYHPILPYLLMKMSFICAPPSLISKLVPPAILIFLSQRILLFVHGHVKARMNMVCLVSQEGS